MSKEDTGFGRGRDQNIISRSREKDSTAKQCQPAGGAAWLTCGAAFSFKSLTAVCYGSSAAASNGEPPCLLIHAAGLVRHMPVREKGGAGGEGKISSSCSCHGCKIPGSKVGLVVIIVTQ